MERAPHWVPETGIRKPGTLAVTSRRVLTILIAELPEQANPFSLLALPKQGPQNKEDDHCANKSASEPFGAGAGETTAS